MERDEVLKSAQRRHEDEGEERLQQRGIDMQLTAMLACTVVIMLLNIALRVIRETDLSIATNAVWCVTVCGLTGSMYGRWRAGDRSPETRRYLIANSIAAGLLLLFYVILAVLA